MNLFCSGRMKRSRKISMKKRETQEQRAVTFSKRRHGLFNKAAELCMLSGSQIGLVVSSPCSKQNLYAFGHPSVEAVFDAFLHDRVPEAGDAETMGSAICLYNAVKDLEEELEKRTVAKKINSEELWKNFEFEQVLERFESLPALKVAVDEMEKLKESAVERLNHLLADENNINGLHRQEADENNINGLHRQEEQHDDGDLGAVTKRYFNQDASVIGNHQVEEKSVVVSGDDHHRYWLNNYQDVVGLESSSSTPTPKQHAFGFGNVNNGF